MPTKGLQLLCFIGALSVVSMSAPAEEAKPGLLGNADLRSMALSPAPLGPPTRFEPPPSLSAQPETFAATPEPEAAARPEPKAAKPAVAKPEPAAPRGFTNTKPRQKPAVAARKQRPTALDSYARDVRRQTWPCTGGGICNWIQPAQ